jgi:predicted phosphodiesterase
MRVPAYNMTPDKIRPIDRPVIRAFGAIGDIHAEDEHLAAALGALGDVDAILSVGDIVDGRGDLARCVQLLRQHNVLAVRGNHERWFLNRTARSLPDAHLVEEASDETREYLERLPPTRVLDTVLGTLLLCHGVGDDDMIRLLPDDDASALAGNDPLQKVLGSGVELMVCGHTHRPMVRTGFGLVVINAGTLHRGDEPGFVRVDLEKKIVQAFGIEGSRVFATERLSFGRPGDDVWGAGF